MIIEIYHWVKEKLTSHPELRDSNERLYYNYLLEIGYDVNKPIKEFLRDMESRKIKYLDVIGRASRKVQENHVELQGKNYKLRTTKKEIEVREEIRQLKHQ
jgi:hypothetical protein